MCDYQYAVVEFSGRVLVPDAGTCYERACEISRSIPPVNGHGVENLSWAYGFDVPMSRSITNQREMNFRDRTLAQVIAATAPPVGPR